MNKPIEDMRTILETKFEYPASHSERVANQILALPADLRAALELYLRHGTISEIVVEDYSVKILTEEFEMEVIPAILTLGWLRREPDRAKRMLSRGYDQVE